MKQGKWFKLGQVGSSLYITDDSDTNYLLSQGHIFYDQIKKMNTHTVCFTYF